MRMSDSVVPPGEYVLVRANSPKVKLDIQGRFEQVSFIFENQNNSKSQIIVIIQDDDDDG